jgi:hypothetical protein
VNARLKALDERIDASLERLERLEPDARAHHDRMLADFDKKNEVKDNYTSVRET